MSRRLLVALLLAAGVAADLVPLWLPASVHAVEPTALEVFRRFYKEKNPELRLKAVSQLAGARGRGVIEALLTALCDEDREVRERSAGILAEPRDSPDEIAELVRVGLGKQPPEVRTLAAHALATVGAKAMPQLRATLDDPQPEVRRVAALSVANLGDREAAPKLSALLTAKEPLVRAAACEGLGILLGEDAVGAASAVLLGERSPEPRIAATEVIGRWPRVGAAEELGRSLADESWSVRVAAARALSGFHVGADCARAAAGPLVRAVQSEKRARVRIELAEALFDLTGIDFGPEPDRWKAWYAEAGQTFEPPVRRPKRRDPDAGATHGHLLDLPLESEHVSFVLDYSHSMTDPIRFGVQTTKREELVKSLDVVFCKLPAEGRFNLIPFGTEPHPYKPALLTATSAAKQTAMHFMERLVPDGRTNIFDSVEIALSDPDADTIVLLTDGAPTEGKRRTRTAIVAGVRQLNRYRLARIHTVEVGAQNTSPRWKGFLKEIADATGGTYLAR
jgi:HEAT repeat protein